MLFRTLMGMGFLGFALGGFGGGGPSPIGPGGSVPTFGNFNPLVLHSQPTEPQGPAVSPGITIPIFKPSDFPFVTIVPDDGTDKSGGWQGAKANLEFFKVNVIPPSVITWKCRINIEMPIRHSTRGYISPATAATMSTTVTNMVTLAMDFDLPQGIFCETFFDGVKSTFPLMYPKLGESVRKW